MTILRSYADLLGGFEFTERIGHSLVVKEPVGDFLALDHELTETERDIRDTVREFATEQHGPHVADWYESGSLPAKDLAKAFGSLCLLDMHVGGYVCAGTSAVAFGIACRELEAIDSGLRSFVSVQGSLAMFALHRWAPKSTARSGCRRWQLARRSVASA